MRVAVVVMDGFTLAKFVHLINQKSTQQAINTEASGTAPEAKTQQFAYRERGEA
jgi:hypothetical protein